MKICPICGKKLLNGTTVCPCGFNFQGTSHIPAQNGAETEFIVNARKTASSKKLKKTLLTSFILILLLSLLGVGLYRYFTVRWHSQTDPVLYLSDGNIMCADIKRSKAKPAVIGALVGTEESFALYEATFISSDKKILLFSNGFDSADEYFTPSYDVYTFDLTKPSQPAVLIAENVTSHTVNSNFDTLTFVRMKDEQANLYQSDFSGNENLICENYGSYSASLDGYRIVWTTEKNELYYKEKDAQPVLLDKNAILIYATEDLEEIIYRTNKGEFIKFSSGEKITLSKNELPTYQISEVNDGISVFSLSDNTVAALKSTNPHNYEVPHELYIGEEKILDNLYYYAHYDSHFKALVVCNLPDESGKTTFTLIKENEIISFDTLISPENSVISLTADGSVIVEDSTDPNNIVVFKNGKKKPSPVIARYYSVPHYPEAVINAENYDFSELKE